MLKKILFQRPTWFRHEGFWRIAQVMRLGPPAALSLFGILVLGAGLVDWNERGSEALDMALGSFVGAIAIFVLVHLALRLIAWIIDGFRPKAA